MTQDSIKEKLKEKPASSMDYEKDFFDFCYDQYKIELAYAEGIYQKASILLGAIVILGGVVAKLTSAEMLLRWHESACILTLGLLTLLVVGLLALSIIFISLAIYPRKYERMAPVAKWQEWLSYHTAHIAVESDSEKPNLLKIQLITVLNNAQQKNIPLNELRMKYYKWAVSMSILATMSTLILALLRLFFFLGGIR